MMVQAGHAPARATREGSAERPSDLPIAFGPVRSRRLGWSLGINNVPPKTCSYSCVYCQVGATDRAGLEREEFFAPDEIVAAVRGRLAQCRVAGQPIDYATFVPDGEPTLDRHLGEAIRGVAALGLPVAVLTNGSLLWRDDVREELAAADWVSIKVDTVDEETWGLVNRPIGGLRLETVLDGMRRFADAYHGELATETMLVAGLNDDDATVGRTAAFISSLEPLRAYVAIPTRPPAEPWVRAPAPEVARHAADILRAAEIPTSCLTEDVEEPFSASADPAEGLLGIVAVHPMTESAARAYLARSGADWSVARRLLDERRIVAVAYEGETYLRGAPGPRRSTRLATRQPRHGPPEREAPGGDSMTSTERTHGLGPGGHCVCQKCGARIPHRPGIRCEDERCPDCAGKMLRDGSEHHRLWLAKHEPERARRPGWR
jgi:wyosine [tRNA(Phe)-imidazoG37] synthetase (radical SAM superfamily)